MVRQIQVIKLNPEDIARYSGDSIIIERHGPVPSYDVPLELDVTDECCTELVKSGSSGGYYVAIRHEDRTLFALGVDEKSKLLPFQSKLYHIHHVPGATVSFLITKRMR